MVAISTLLAGAGLGANLISGFSANKRANKQADAAIAIQNRQLESLDRQEGIYDEGADALQSVIADLLSAYGGRGQYDPGYIDDLANLLSQERAQGETETQSDILQQNVLQKRRSNTELLEQLNLGAKMFAPTAGNVGNRANINTTFTPNKYDGAVAELANMYKSNLDTMSKRNLDEAMGKILTDSQRRLGGAVTGQRTVAARQMADQMNESEARNTLNAINMAMQQMSGLQGLDTGLQRGNIAAQGADISGLNFDRSMQDLAFRQAIQSATTGQAITQGAQQGDRANIAGAMGMLEGVDSLNRNTDILDYQTALATLGQEQALATTTLDTGQKLATAPFSYRVQGPAGVLSSAPAAANTAGALLETYANAAGGAFNAAGASADKLLKESNLGNTSFSDLFAPSPASTPSIDPMFGGSATAGSSYVAPAGFQTAKLYQEYL